MQEYKDYMESAKQLSSLKFFLSFNRYTLENKFFYHTDLIQKQYDNDDFVIAIVRKAEMVGRTVKNLVIYSNYSQSLTDFIVENFLIDVDLYTSSSMAIYEMRNKPIGILVLPHPLDPIEY
jgi:hypothetical protein